MHLCSGQGSAPHLHCSKLVKQEESWVSTAVVMGAGSFQPPRPSSRVRVTSSSCRESGWGQQARPGWLAGLTYHPPTGICRVPCQRRLKSGGASCHARSAGQHNEQLRCRSGGTEHAEHATQGARRFCKSVPPTLTCTQLNAWYTRSAPPSMVLPTEQGYEAGTLWRSCSGEMAHQ